MHCFRSLWSLFHGKNIVLNFLIFGFFLVPILPLLSKNDSMRGDGWGTAACQAEHPEAEAMKPDWDWSGQKEADRGRGRELEKQGVMDWLNARKLKSWIVLWLYKRNHSNATCDLYIQYCLIKGEINMLKR